MQHSTNERHGTSRKWFFKPLILIPLLLIMNILPACSQQVDTEARLRVSITSGQAPLTVAFVNASRNAEEFQWDFGDGSTITTKTIGQVMTHEYTEAGTHTVTLTAIKRGESPKTSATSVDITVRPGPVHRVTLIPELLELACEQSQKITAEALDAYDNPIPDAELSWKVADKKVGTISSDGTFTAGTKAGSFSRGITLNASWKDHSAKTTVPVKIMPGPLDRVKLDPEALELAGGQSQQFTAEAVDAYDNPVPEVQLTWEVDPGLGTITSSGRLTAGTEPGVFSEGVVVTAELNNYSAEATASVTVGNSTPVTANITPPVTDNVTPPVNGNGGLEAVTIPDSNLEKAIRAATGRPEGPIYKANLAAITSLSAREASISNVTGLEYCVNLTVLSLGANNISDISPLAGLVNLFDLRVERNRVKDLTPLANLTRLTNLQLDRNQISNISPLANLTNLTDLQLQGNQIISVSPLANLTNLTNLVIGYNQINDFSPLGGLTSLTRLIINDNDINDFSLLPLEDPAFLPSLTMLEIGHNQISEVSSLAGRTKLDYLHLDACNIIDISPLSDLTNLTTLRLYDNHIIDLSPLSNLTNLTYVSLDDNRINDLSPLSNLTNLTRIPLGKNQIVDISPLSNLTNLTILYLDDNKISDISPLANLTKLNDLHLNINKIVDITPLSNLTNLDRLYLQGNKIIDISPLLANTGLSDGDSVELSYNPLSTTSVNTHIPELEARGVKVMWTP